MIGSSFFVAHPPVPLDHVVGMINMDMVGRVRNQTIYVGGDGTAADLLQLLHDADAGSPLAVRGIGRGGFGPSDHMSFALKHVPVLFLFSGMHRDYHTPTDTAEKINYPGIVETADLARRLVDEMATMPRESYVDKYDNEGLNLFATASIGSAPPVVLGVVPDYASMQAQAGVRISSTTPGMPAQAAGLREGDVIVQIGATKIANLMDLMAFLSDAKPGQTVTIVVMRDKQRIEAPTTLAERKG
jgi:peptidase M28-like protein/PDZ domain-containing protein